MAAEWHYSKDGQQHGPVSASDLKNLAKSGDLLPTDLIWKEGMAEWKPASNVKGLFSATPESSKASPASPQVEALPVVPGTAKKQTLVEAARGAAQYAAKQTERTELMNLTLPPLYQSLGRDAVTSPEFRAEFAEQFQQLDQVQAELSEISGRSPAAAKSFGDKAKAMAGQAMQAAQSQKLSMRQSSLFGTLGKAMYDKHEDASGPQELVKPIADTVARLAMLDSELDGLSATKDGSWITPKRLAISIGAAACVLLLIFMLMLRGGSSHSLPVLDFSKGPNGEEVVKVEERKRIFFVFKDKEKGKVRHGLFTEFYDIERTNKRLEGDCYAGEWHGTVTESYESGEKRTERVYDRGKCVGTHQGFDKDGKIVWSLSFDGEGTAILAKSSTRAALSQIRFITDWNSLPPERKVGSSGRCVLRVERAWTCRCDLGLGNNPPDHRSRHVHEFVVSHVWGSGV